MAEFFINGSWTPSTGSGGSMEVVNPADGAVVDSVPIGVEADVDEAVAAATAAFPGWWETPAAKRGEALAAGAAAVKAEAGRLAALLTAEQGKPLREAKMEIFRFAHTLEHYAGLAKNIRGGSVPDLDAEPRRLGLVLKRPLGVCAAITPWNFPVSLAGNKLGPGLVTGNTFVVKPASTTPLTLLEVAAVLHGAGLPAGALNVVAGPGGTVGEALITHPGVAKVGFTGSTEVGKRVMAAASDSVKRVTLELGGSDPFIVCADADVAQAASACSVGRFFNCGQACLAVKRVYVEDAVYEEFRDLMVAKVSRLTVGPGTDPDARLGPLHTAGQRAEVEGQVADAVDRGAKVLAGGARPEGEAFERGHFMLPTLLEDAPHESAVSREEVFGPALPLWRVADLDEAIERANDSPFGLGSSVWTRDIGKAMTSAERIEAGYTWINSISKIYDELPFGGFKESGLGKEHGLEALEHYQNSKAVVLATE